MTLCERKSGGRILCIRLSGLGDIIHALNALTVLRKYRPAAHIAWVVEDRFSSLLRGHPYIDELITVPRLAWGRALKFPLKWGGVLREVARIAAGLRDREFEISIDFQSALKSAWLVAAAGAEKRVGFRWNVAREFSPLFNNTFVRVLGSDCHRIERDLALLAPLGIPARYEDAVLVCSDRDSEVIDRAVAERRRGGPLVIIHPGTSDFAAFKRWRPEGYAAVADRLIEEKGADVMVSWGPGEEPLARAVLERMALEGTLAPRTENLEQLTHLLSCADLFIGSDTGPMHLAAALKVPTLALFGPKDPVQTGPYPSRSIVVTGRAPCRPCRRRQCERPLCMETIGEEEVHAAACRLLAGGGERRAREGPIKKAFVFDFELGDREGQINCSYSAPDFYRWLCMPQGITRAPEARIIERRPAGGQDRTTTLVKKSADGHEVELVVHAYGRPGKLLRRVAETVLPSKAIGAWHRALRFAREDIPTPFPVCYMRRGRVRTKEELVVLERLPGAVPLREWLSPEREDGWAALSGRERLHCIEALARLIRDLHRKNFCHIAPADKTISVLRRGARREVRFAIGDVEGVRWIGWMPVMFRHVLRGLDLRKALQRAPICTAKGDKSKFFGAYFAGFIEGRRGQELIKWVVENLPEGWGNGE